MNQKRPNAQYTPSAKPLPDTFQVPAETALSIPETPAEETVEVVQKTVEVVQETKAVEVPVTPEPVQRASSESRVVALRERLDRFPTEFPTNKAMTNAEIAAMVRYIETTMNILFSASSSSEAAAMLTALRAALHENRGNTFASERTLGRMIEPRSGRMLVSNERTMSIMALLYLTANPVVFKAQKGRIDVSSSVKGMQSEIATFIIEYYS